VSSGLLSPSRGACRPRSSLGCGLSIKRALFSSIDKERVSRESTQNVLRGSPPRGTPFLKTLNTSDFPWAVSHAPLVGSIGHVRPFIESCYLAEQHGFDAVNLDVDFLKQFGPEAVKDVLKSHNLRPGAYRFPVRLTDESDDAQFVSDLKIFEEEAPLAAAAGFTTSAMHLLPWSESNLPFGEHFRLVQRRLKAVAPIIRDLDLHVGLEFIGTWGLRRTRENDFIHTIEGVRCLTAAADIESHVGLKLDTYHWWCTGGQLEELLKLKAHEVAYVELNDAVPGFSMASCPELSRELPGHTGIIDSAGMLAALKHIGYKGPVVAEPFNRRIQALPPSTAVAAVSNSLDLIFAVSQRRMLPEELIGAHPYQTEIKQPTIASEEEEKRLLDPVRAVQLSQSPLFDIATTSAQASKRWVKSRTATKTPTQGVRMRTSHTRVSWPGPEMLRPKGTPPAFPRPGVRRFSTSVSETDNEGWRETEFLHDADSVYPAGPGPGFDAEPLDVRLGLTTTAPTLPGGGLGAPPPLRWGVLACGKVANDFVQALKIVPNASVEAVGARDLGRAQAFAETHGVTMAYGSYKEVVEDPNVDIVYVATLHTDHREHAELALNAGKHVLIEKPVAMDSKEAEAVYALAKVKGLFALEGMWTRFMPAVEHARELLESGAIGDVTLTSADFCINGSDVGPHPTDTIFDADLGGGAVRILGGYTIGAAMLANGKGMPDSIQAAGVMDAAKPVGGGAELSGSGVLKYDGVGGGAGGSTDGSRPFGSGAGGTAVLSTGWLGESSEVTLYVGSKGRITILPPAHCPTHLCVELKGEGRAGGSGYQFGFPLPEESEDIAAAGGFIMPNSQGFAYEAAAVARCIAAGLTEAPQWTPEESINCMKINEQMISSITQSAKASSSSPSPSPSLKHIVAVSLKEGSDVAAFCDAILSLEKSCAPLVLSSSGGPNVSPEGKANGLTHTFVMDFASEADRDEYLTHPAHIKFGEEFGPMVQDVFVSDHWA